MSNKNNNKQNIDFSPILNSLENINNTLKTIANVFYNQNNQNNEQQRRIEESINRQLNLFRDVAATFRNVLYQLRQEEAEQRRNRRQDNQNNNQHQSFIRTNLRRLISALGNLGRYQIVTFQSIDRFLKVENEFRTRQAREINNLFSRINNNSQRFFRQFIQEIDEIYNENNYFKSMAESLKHIAEVYILLKPFVRNMVARGINPFCCGTGFGLGSNLNQLLHVGGEDVQTNLARVLRYARFGTVIEEDILNILSNIEQNQHSFRKFFSKIPLIGRIALNDQIRLLKAAQSGVLQNFLQTAYFNLNERILERFFSFDIRRRERFQNQLIQLISRYVDRQGRIDETILVNLSNNINRLTNYIETFNRYSQYFTNVDRFAINKLLLNLDNHFILQTRFLESLENITQDLDIQLRAYNATLQNQLSEDTLRDVNNILRSVVLRDIARGRISEANLSEINSMIENILRQRNLSEEQIRVFLNLISNVYSRLSSNYSEHLRDAIEREYQYRGVSRKTIDDLARRLGSEYANLAEEIAKDIILRQSKIFRFTTGLLNNKIYKLIETITVSIAFKTFFLFKIPFIGPALAGLGFPWNIAVGLLFAPLIYKRGAIISFMMRHLTPLLQKGFGKVQNLLSKYIPDSVKNFFDIVTINVRNIITKIRQSRFWNNTFMFKLRTIIGTSIGNVFRSLLGFNLKQPSQPIQPEVIQRAYTGETAQTLNLQQNQVSVEFMLNNIREIIDNLNQTLSNIINNLQSTLTNILNRLNGNISRIRVNFDLNKLVNSLQNLINNLQNLKGINMDEAFKQGLSDNIRLIGEILENINKQSINIDNRLQTLDESLNKLYNQYAIKKDGIDSLKVYVTNFDDLCKCIRNKSSIPPMPGINSFIGSSLFGFGDPTSMLLWALISFAPHLLGGTRGLFRLGWKGLKWLGGKGWEGLKWLGGKSWEGLKWLGSKSWEGLKWLRGRGSGLLTQAIGSGLMRSAAGLLGRFALSRSAGAAIGGLIGGPIGLLAGLALPFLVDYAADKLLNNSEDTQKFNNAAMTDIGANINTTQNTSIAQYDYASLYNVLQTQVEYQKQTNNILNNIHNTLQTIDSSINDINSILKNKPVKTSNTFDITQNNNTMNTQAQQSTDILDKINQLKRRFGF